MSARSKAYEAWVARARAVTIESEIKRRGIKLRAQGAEQIGPCPLCGGDDRFSISMKKQVWNCRGCRVGGDVIKLVEHLDGVDFAKAVASLTGEPTPVKSNGWDRSAKPRTVVAAEYPYEDETGTTVLVVERVEYRNPDGTYVVTENGKRKKKFRQKRPDPANAGSWIWNVHGTATVPYRLPELIEAIANEYIIVVAEGERKVDHLRSLDVPATCCAGGAGKWKPEHSAFLRGADIVLIPDNDDRGYKHIQEVGSALTGIAKRIRVVVLPGLQPKDDIVDWMAAGGTREALDRLIADAPEWRPAPVPSLETARAKAEADEQKIIDALANLRPGIEFAQQRKKAAKELGVSIADIDAELEAHRDEKAIAPLYGHWITEPWPEVAEGDSLLRDIIRRLLRHVVCSHENAIAIALWIMFAWVHDEVATHSPILLITSAQPESGKSTTLGLIKFLAPRCVASVEISEAAIYRAIELWQPSFAIDEFDSVLSGDDKAGLRSVINSGHTRGQGVIRCVEPDFTPRQFETFCPKALGMVGRKLPDATLSRCVVVELRRRKSTEQIVRFEHRDDAELSQLRSRLARWAMDNEKALGAADPTMPSGFENRCADNWRVMFAIADLAGEDWGEKARAAASRLELASDTTSIGVQLLAAIKRIFDAEGGDSMLSATLVAKLKEDEEQPWAAWGRGKGLTQNSLATLLGGGGGRGRGSRGGFGIRSQNIRLANGTQGKGYKRSQFEDGWERYLPSESPGDPIP